MIATMVPTPMYMLTSLAVAYGNLIPARRRAQSPMSPL